MSFVFLEMGNMLMRFFNTNNVQDVIRKCLKVV